MSKKNYTNKQQKQFQKPKVRVPVPGKTIFHKSDKDYDRRQNAEVISFELDELDQEATNEENQIEGI